MYNSKAKGSNTVPSDGQAREKLASYVYEYLMHAGASKAAETFLRETRWSVPPNLNLQDPPGFLQSWWCVFWDLYCAAPDRRESNDGGYSSEAKAFHEYDAARVQQNNGVQPQYMNGIRHQNSNAPSPLGAMPPTEAMAGGPMSPANFFTNSHMRPSPPQQPVNQPSPHSQPMMPGQQFIQPRFTAGPGSRPGNVRMSQPTDFNAPPGAVAGQPMMPNTIDPSRQGTFLTCDGSEFVAWQGPPGMQQMNPRMAGPHPGSRVPPMAQMGNMGQFAPSMRPPNVPNGPAVNGQNGQQNGQPLPPLNMSGSGGPGGRPWQPNNNMAYNSSSPGNHYGPPGSNSGPGPAPGTPILPSPQGSAGPYSPASHRMNTGTPNTGRDSSGPVGDGMYPMIKQGGNIPNFVMGDVSMHAPPTSSPMAPDPLLESIKQSPGSHVPADQNNVDHNTLDYNNMVPFSENDQNESAAILKIKESMQEEAKRFEKDTPGDHTEFFMQ